MIGPNLPGNVFTRLSINQNAPTVSGVYAIYNSTQWIYIGEGQDIGDRLLKHLNGDNPRITRANPAGFQFEAVPAHLRVARQDELILRLHPVANQRLG